MGKKRKKTADIKRGRRSVRKGKRGEDEACEILSRILGIEIYRGSNKDSRGWSGVHVEIKREENLGLYAALLKAIADMRLGEVPMVVHRRNNRRWVISYFLDDLVHVNDRVQEAMRSDE